jgi:hypothetical protein
MTTNLQDKFILYISTILICIFIISNNVYSVKILASINKIPITDVDLDQRIAMLEKLNVINLKDADINQIKVAILRNMTDEKIVVSYINDYIKHNKIDINFDKDIANMSNEIIKKIGKNDKITQETITDYAKSNAYMGVFNSIIVNNINITDDEILNLAKTKNLDLNEINKAKLREEIIREKYPDKVNKALNKIKKLNYIDVK